MKEEGACFTQQQQLSFQVHTGRLTERLTHSLTHCSLTHVLVLSDEGVCADNIQRRNSEKSVSQFENNNNNNNDNDNNDNTRRESRTTVTHCTLRCMRYA